MRNTLTYTINNGFYVKAKVQQIKKKRTQKETQRRCPKHFYIMMIDHKSNGICINRKKNNINTKWQTLLNQPELPILNVSHRTHTEYIAYRDTSETWKKPQWDCDDIFFCLPSPPPNESPFIYNALDSSFVCMYNKQNVKSYVRMSFYDSYVGIFFRWRLFTFVMLTHTHSNKKNI